ncbi:DUF1592 domain-containing protein [Pirellulaceae bacterium]|nr:DUF1592 domain-containing protein [Pirellulaceae bacterium]
MKWLPIFVILTVVMTTPSRSPTQDFKELIQPLLKEFCITCHSAEKQKGELDLERFSTVAQIKQQPQIWEAVLHQISDREMPPEDSKQFSATQKQQFTRWVQATLDEFALENAGDPGPVVLRRLSNREYTYTVRDLTGVNTLNPAREFPIDGAAGEGFTNVGSALVMSPVLLTKYLDAAKEIADHAMLLPDGIHFSSSTSSRDWTDQTLAEIRELYAQTSSSTGASAMNLQGVKFDTNAGGRLSVKEYVSALRDEKEALLSEKLTVKTLARTRNLNEKYLGLLWQMLNQENPSLLLAELQSRWRAGKMAASDIQPWQQSLWRFTSVGHIGKVNGPKAWQEPVNPLAASAELRLKLTAPENGRQVTVYLSAGSAGDGSDHDAVIWERPRLVIAGYPEIPLRGVGGLVQRIENMVNDETARTLEYLQVIAETHHSSKPIEDLAIQRGLNLNVLKNWVSTVQLGSFSTPVVQGHFQEKLTKIGGYADFSGWGRSQTPNLLVNKNADTIKFTTLTVPGRSFNVHPSPTKDAIVYWQSPINGSVRIQGSFADSDGVCGNGVAWRIELVTRGNADTIVSGVFDNGNRSEFNSTKKLAVQPGDLLKIIVNARDKSHACDTTQVELTVTEQGGDQRVWDLAKEVVDRIQTANPLSDSFGNADVWHFCESTEKAPSKSVIPNGSALAQWRAAVIAENANVNEIAQTVQQVISGKSSGLNAGNKTLRETIRAPRGPMKWFELSAGKVEGENIESIAPSIMEFKIPAGLAENAEVVVTGRLHPEKGKEGSVQFQLSTDKPQGVNQITAGKAQTANINGKWSDNNLRTKHTAPIVVNAASESRRRFESAFDDFRELFPAALCYAKIVPVDEVVTLTLFYREDEHLQRLMLNDTQSKRLDRLWEKLQFVSQSPLKQVDAYEQLYQFATQDADPSAFAPLREPLQKQAAKFRKRLIEVQPQHVQGVLDFAAKAWRRPATTAEQNRLRKLYTALRDQELPHQAAVRQVLARILIAPAFLYRGEQPGPGTNAAPVNNWELATRLSYFLWSSAPDDQLRALAETGQLQQQQVLVAQMKRMMTDDRIRRLATEFGAQYLHVRDLETLDEKSERHFPTFPSLRGAMQEESVRFFIDLFQNNRSALSLLDADHTFVNGPLAQHYGMSGISAESLQWRRVDGIRAIGRGGVLGFSSTLARQSGASRTSPILRGNWVSEVLLGEKLPRPPKDVPVLPDEPPQGLTERQLIQRHSNDQACARCHQRIDPFGFALEGFDAIGRFRSQDESGLKINTTSKLPDGTEIDGIEGLRQYLLESRRDDFLRQFCRKLTGYALGRSVQLSDRPLIDEMIVQLKANRYHINHAIEMIVCSPQFRELRGRDR